jgi:HEAT repeat protein
VRLVVLRAIAAQSYRAALPRLDALIRERRLRERDLTEQMAAFEAFGSLCGDEQVGVLDQLLNGRSLIGRRQDPSLRACAAVALGRVKSERARAALARAADEKDVVVRAAVQRAVRGQP